MGTRGAIGFRVDGADKLTYNHFDSYPEVLGAEMIATIRRHTDDELAETARRIQLVEETEGSAPVEMIERYQAFANLNVGGRMDGNNGGVTWYQLLRQAQGELEPYVDGRIDHMIDSNSFVYDGLFCEWAYVVNVDDGALEVYQGFSQAPDGPGRYANPPAEHQGDKSEISGKYYGVTLVEAVPFEQLRNINASEVAAVLQSWEEAKRWGAEDDDDELEDDELEDATAE